MLQLPELVRHLIRAIAGWVACSSYGGAMLDIGQLPLSALRSSTLCSLMACMTAAGQTLSNQQIAGWDGYRTCASQMWRFRSAALEAAGAVGIQSPLFAADGCDWRMAAFIIDGALYLGLKCTPLAGAPADWQRRVHYK